MIIKISIENIHEELLIKIDVRVKIKLISYSNISNKLKLKIQFLKNYQKKLERKLYKLKICTLNQISAENVWKKCVKERNMRLKGWK